MTETPAFLADLPCLLFFRVIGFFLKSAVKSIFSTVNLLLKLSNVCVDEVVLFRAVAVKREVTRIQTCADAIFVR